MFCLANKMWDDKSFSESWNFGPSHTDTTCNVKQIVEKVIKNWGGDASYDINNKKSFKESNFLLLNSQKAQNKLNWHPVFDIDKTISETINWYKTHYYKTDEISGYTKNCIQSYVKHAEKLKLKWMSKTIE
jgi:CDP-glucose 4,6-dehydratase